MAERPLTSFEHILLGLICTAPSSGYDLKRIFAVTPMGVYQPSSGTLYPALRRLELIGMIQAQTPSGQNGSSARHRRVYEPT
jgi:DNA-binding PadR family transcriptional regulator